jgi:hypothetical protein
LGPPHGGYQRGEAFRQLFIAEAPSEHKCILGASLIDLPVRKRGDGIETLPFEEALEGGIFSLVAGPGDHPTD